VARPRRSRALVTDGKSSPRSRREKP
jgi:hypothetical protein